MYIRRLLTDDKTLEPAADEFGRLVAKFVWDNRYDTSLDGLLELVTKYVNEITENGDNPCGFVITKDTLRIVRRLALTIRAYDVYMHTLGISVFKRIF